MITGITPAYAGNTFESKFTGKVAEDHPRLRGEHALRCPNKKEARGSPPLTRGTQRSDTCVCQSGGITPAYAGNTMYIFRTTLLYQDHPRLRGEHHNSLNSSLSSMGSPPLTRGTLYGYYRHKVERGITPAYAGNTMFFFSFVFPCRDHPRTPMRKFSRRITPAYAGNTFLCTICPLLGGDHPRLRGEHTL